MDKKPDDFHESSIQFYSRIVSLKYSISQLAKSRSSTKSERYDDLKVLDGMRVLALLWVSMLGVC